MLFKPTLLAALSLLTASLSSAAPIIPNPAAAVPDVVTTVGSGVLPVAKDALAGGLGRRGLPIVGEILGGGEKEDSAGSGGGGLLGRRQFDGLPVVGPVIGGLLGGGNQNKPKPSPAQPSVASAVPAPDQPTDPSTVPNIVPPPAGDAAEGVAGGLLGRRQDGLPIVGDLLGGKGDEAPSAAPPPAPESESESESGLTPEDIKEIEGMVPSRMASACATVCRPVKPVCEAGEVATGSEVC